jgi:hypothetical protein
MADPLIANKTLYLIPDVPHFSLPAYAVFSNNTNSEESQQALDILRQLVLEKTKIDPE